MRPRGSIVAAAILVSGLARADGVEMRVVFGNDAFDGVLSHPDDNGFTNDLGIAIRNRDGDFAIGGKFLDRMITSSAVMRRSDLIELFATIAWVLDDCLSIELRAGPTAAGELGGHWVQMHWHRLTGTGPRDPRETPAIYMDELRAGGVTGARADAGFGGPLRAYGSLDGQVAFGATGVSFVESAAGILASAQIGRVVLGAFGELAVGRYHVSDAELAVPGAYRPGWQLDGRLGVRVGIGRYRLGFAYHTNETSSGEAFSEITFERL